MNRYLQIPLLSIILILVGCSSNRSTTIDSNKPLSFAEVKLQYVNHLDNFLEAAIDKDINKMYSMTSKESIKKYGIDPFKHIYNNLLIPHIATCKALILNQRIMEPIHEIGIGKGYTFQKVCTNGKEIPSFLHIKVLKSPNNKFVISGVRIFAPNK